jgi:hypothetical protein
VITCARILPDTCRGVRSGIVESDRSLGYEGRFHADQGSFCVHNTDTYCRNDAALEASRA